MTTLKKQYAELLALTQLYLFQEYTLQKRLCVDIGAHEVFKQYALSQKAPPTEITQASLPQASMEPFQVASAPIPPPAPKTLPPASQKSQKVLQDTPLKEPANERPMAKAPDSQKEIKQEAVTSAFKLEPLESPPPVNLSDFRAIFSEKFPGQPILDQLPDDQSARVRTWERDMSSIEVLILSFHETTKYRQFLNHLRVAVESLGMRAAVLAVREQERDFDHLLKNKNLRMIIACANILFARPDLMKHYKEAPKKGRQYLGAVPLLLLSDLSVYFKEPSLKMSLWTALLPLAAP
jgi:hypothetical protein